jgi:hypothetical protein
LALFGHDPGVMPKSILSDEFGVKPEQSRWIIGGIDCSEKPTGFELSLRQAQTYAKMVFGTSETYRTAGWFPVTGLNAA